MVIYQKREQADQNFTLSKAKTVSGISTYEYFNPSECDRASFLKLNHHSIQGR
jgi:hypothetical protein